MARVMGWHFDYVRGVGSGWDGRRVNEPSPGLDLGGIMSGLTGLILMLPPEECNPYHVRLDKEQLIPTLKVLEPLTQLIRYAGKTAAPISEQFILHFDQQQGLFTLRPFITNLFYLNIKQMCLFTVVRVCINV